MKRYVVLSRVFDGIDHASVPLSGQICTDSSIIANVIFYMLRKWSYKHYGTICVSLYEKGENGLYNAIKR